MKELFKALIATAVLAVGLQAHAQTPMSQSFIADNVVLMATNNLGVTNLLSTQFWPGNKTNYNNTVYTNLTLGVKVFVVATNSFVAGTAPTGCTATTNDTTQLFKDVTLNVDRQGSAIAYSEAGKSATNTALGTISITLGYHSQSNTLAFVFAPVYGVTRDRPNGYEVSNPNALIVITATNAYNSVNTIANEAYWTSITPISTAQVGHAQKLRLVSVLSANAGAANIFPIWGVRWNTFLP